jgi:hypothetical protein
MRPVIIFTLWNLIGNDWTPRGSASGGMERRVRSSFHCDLDYLATVGDKRTIFKKGHVVGIGTFGWQ